jgi:DNA helicase-2/ATP-dependent DNA helicase PcrA
VNTELLYQDAIQSTEQNLRIIACAGSGKTKFVAERVTFLIKSGVLPENIIAFTYTEKAAAELNHRIVSELRKQGVMQDAVQGLNGFADMYIGTMHGWCLKALQDNEIGYQKFGVLDEIKLKLFVDKNYNRIGMKGITKIGNGNVNMKIFTDTNRFIQLMNIVRESNSVGDLDLDISESLLTYESCLRGSGYFDFTMIMTDALKKLKDPNSALSNKMIESLKFLIVDEFQDVNPIQEKIISELHERTKCKVTVVGDDDQNIYQWRGSNSKFLQEFDLTYSKYLPVKSLKLVTNYRSSKGIIGLARQFIERNVNRIPKEMTSGEKQEFIRDEDILYNEYSNIEEENASIVNRIKKLRGVTFVKDGEKRGIDYSDFCVLIRTWKKSENIVAALEKNNIPYVTGGVNQLFTRSEVRAAVAIFKYLQHEIPMQSLHDLWKATPNNCIDETSLATAIENLAKWFPKDFQAHRNSVSWGDFNLQEIYWEFLKDAGIVEESFIESNNKSSIIQAEIVFYNLGKFSQVINDFEEINLNSSPPSFHLFNFLNFIKFAAQDYYPEGWLNNPYKTPNAVQVMTIHQAKGLEFPVVFIPGLNSNYFPLKRPGGLNVWHFLDRNSIEDQERYEARDDEMRYEDERRLMYVGITRSQKFLFISRAPDHNNRLYKKVSRFQAELVSDFISEPLLEMAYTDRERSEPTPREETVTISLNFSILKDFFQCNYRFKLVSMYAFCAPLNQRMGMGKSIHDSLMAIHKSLSEGQELNRSTLEEIAREQFHFPYLGKSPELEIMKAKVIENTVEYFEKNKESLKGIEFYEKDIKLNLDDGVFVSGRVDLTKKRLYENKYETTIMEFKSNDKVQTKTLSVDQLNLYALGYKELTGNNADYIQVYDVESNEAQHRSPVEESLLSETREKIGKAAKNIRGQDLPRIESKEVCASCFQNRVCSARKKFRLPGKK